ncbi:MAG: hypothetical protein ACRD19_11090 [Terriglobia bacterium]
MAKSQIFYTDKYKEIEERIVETLDEEEDYLSVRTADSTRAVGDAIQAILSQNFKELLGDLCSEYSANFARRAMADLAFTDCNGFYYIVDVKTHRLGTAFNMPNLSSVERPTRFYEDDKNYFVLLIVKYATRGIKVTVERVHFIPIEFLSWECLTIGALGWGQIQIANANQLQISDKYSRREWMLQLCDIMLEFYPKEIGKIAKRTDYFKCAKVFWENKPQT